MRVGERYKVIFERLDGREEINTYTNPELVAHVWPFGVPGRACIGAGVMGARVIELHWLLHRPAIYRESHATGGRYVCVHVQLPVTSSQHH